VARLYVDCLPLPLSTFAGYDLTELELMTMQAKSDEDQKRKALLKKVPKTQEEEVAESAEGVEEGGDEEVIEGGGQEDEVAKAGDAEVQVQAEDGDQAQVEQQVEEQTGGADGEEKPVHEGWMCDGCKMCPIVGTRYKCLE
jgi:hypothetical protein